MTMSKMVVAAVLVTLLGLSGCGGDDAASPVVTQTVTTTPESSATTSEETEAPAVLTQKSDAKDVIEALKGAGLPISKVIIYTKSSDPNGQLGQPGSYTSKGSFVDGRVNSDDVADADRGSIDLGGGVEVFEDDSRAEARALYIEQAIKGLGGLVAAENDVVSGGILLRLSGYLSPKDVEQYRSALGELTGEKSVLVVKA